MQIKRILCPIDFSESSTAVNKYASSLAEPFLSRIVYLHIVPPDTPLGMYGFDVVAESEREQVKLKKFKPTQSGVEFEHFVKAGEPADKIVSFAREHDIDLIVMGTHGRTGLERVLMGSVAEAVVRKAECPVLAIKDNSKKPQATIA